MATHSRTDVPEQTHESMRAAAARTVSGPASTPSLAAGGGLELPGGEGRNTAVPSVGGDQQSPHEPIPGERDESTLTHRQPGAIGGAFNGEDNVTTDVDTRVDDQVRRELMREGGGADGERQFKRHEKERRER